MARISAKDTVLQLSADGVTYKTVVCEIGHTFNRERSTNSVETKCYGGVAYVSVGAISGSIDFTGLFETQPSATQVSADDILGFIENGTYLYWKITAGLSGDERYRQGNGYVTSDSEDAQIGDNVGFNFTLIIDGAVDITA